MQAGPKWLSLLLLVCSVQVAAQKPGVKPSVTVKSQTETFDTKIVRSGELSVGQKLTFNLTEKVSLVGVVDRVDAPAPGVKSWSGSLEGTPGNFTLVNYNDQQFLDIHAGDRFYEVRPARGKRFQVMDVDATSLPECATPAATGAHSTRSVISAGVPDVCDADPPGIPVVIDTLVGYTKAARIAAGGESAIEGLILLNVDETNQAFQRSNIRARLRLAMESPRVATAPSRPRSPDPEEPRLCMKEISYRETGVIATDLDKLTRVLNQDTDVRTVREACHADVVVLIVEDGGGYGGIAHVMTSLSSAFASKAFGVVVRRSSSGNYAFTHEIAHMMGAGHDVGNGGPAMCAYSSGLRFDYGRARYKSMMAYRCPGTTPNCGNKGIKTLNFSDPNILYNGDGPPTGDAATANNARTLRISAETVSRFR